MDRLMPACWTQGDLAARLAAEGGRSCTSNTLSLWRTGKRERMTESQRAAVILLLPKLEAKARAIRVSAMAEARILAVGARDRRARQVAEAMEVRRWQAEWEAAQLEKRKRLDEANRLKLEREEAARLERAERDRWQSVQSVDLELVAPHGLWAAGEDLLVDRRPLELRVRIRDHRGMCSSIHPASTSICLSTVLASHASTIFYPRTTVARTHWQVRPRATRCRRSSHSSSRTAPCCSGVARSPPSCSVAGAMTSGASGEKGGRCGSTIPSTNAGSIERCASCVRRGTWSFRGSVLVSSLNRRPSRQWPRRIPSADWSRTTRLRWQLREKLPPPLPRPMRG